MCWNIWKSRNAAVFRSIRPVASESLGHALSDAALWTNSYPSPTAPQRRPVPPVSPLTPPHLNDNPLPRTMTLRVHCDGSFLEGPQTAAYGVVVTSSMGQICDGRAGNFVCSSPIVAEAKALLEAVSYAARSPHQCMVFSDCLTLINCLHSNCT
ncbi:hypothetical protein LINPERHAP1_LOCUS24582 [Linum perenne]